MVLVFYTNPLLSRMAKAVGNPVDILSEILGKNPKLSDRLRSHIEIAMKDPFDVGTKLKQLRLHTGWTQEWIADQLGVPKSTYCDWERGVSVPKHEIIQKVAALYKVDPSLFFTTEKLQITVTGNRGDHGYVANNGYVTIENQQQHNIPIEVVEKWMRESREREARLMEFMERQAVLLDRLSKG